MNTRDFCRKIIIEFAIKESPALDIIMVSTELLSKSCIFSDDLAEIYSAMKAEYGNEPESVEAEETTEADAVEEPDIVVEQPEPIDDVEPASEPEPGQESGDTAEEELDN